MKLIVVSQDFPPAIGGIQVYTHQLAIEFSRRYDVIVIAPSRKGDVAFDKEQPYETVRYPIGHTSLFGVTTPASVSAIARRFGAKTTFHAQYSTAFGSLTAKMAKIIDRYFIAAHAREILRENFGPVHHVFRDLTLSNATALFPISRFTRQLILDRKVPPEKVHVVPNGVNLSLFSPKETNDLRETLRLQGNRVILTAARLVSHKGVDTTLAAFDRIADKFPDTVYLIIGNGPEKDYLMQCAGDRLVSGQVRFLGTVPYEELPLYDSLADLFVMGSRQERGGSVEGFGLVFLEANACKTPVIGTRSGGIPDAIEEGVSGLLVPPDDVEAMAQSMEQLLSSPEQIHSLGKLGFERAKDYTWSICAERIMDHMEAHL